MKNGNQEAMAYQLRRSILGARIAVVLTMAGSATPAPSADFKLSDAIEMTISATITAGTGIRTENPSSANYGSLAGSRVGRSGGLTSVNSGGPDLNFERGRSYSTVLKGFADFDIHGKTMGAFARVKAWHDYELANGDRPYGNFPNGFAQGVPLSDNGFA